MGLGIACEMVYFGENGFDVDGESISKILDDLGLGLCFGLQHKQVVSCFNALLIVLGHVGNDFGKFLESGELAYLPILQLGQASSAEQPLNMVGRTYFEDDVVGLVLAASRALEFGKF